MEHSTMLIPPDSSFSSASHLLRVGPHLCLHLQPSQLPPETDRAWTNRWALLCEALEPVLDHLDLTHRTPGTPGLGG